MIRNEEDFLTYNGLKYLDDVLYYEDVNLNDIVANFETPCYLYSKNQIVKNYTAYQDALKEKGFSNFLIAYAIKANFNSTIIKILRELGSGIDAVSGNEVRFAIQNGIDPKKIVFSGLGKTDEDIEYAINNQILQINVESLQELDSISFIANKLNKKIDVALRVNVDVVPNTHAKITTSAKGNKFGIDPADMPSLMNVINDNKNVELCGLSMHIGSQILDIEIFKEAFRKFNDILKKYNIKSTSIDLGCGVGIPYKAGDNVPDVNQYVEYIYNEFAINDNVKVIIEPGRSLVGNAGIILAKVLYIKDSYGKKFVILNAGMNNIIRPAMYGAYHHIVPLKNGEKRERYSFVGPICESSDVFSDEIDFCELKKGDFVAILSTGAYCASLASFYNMFDIAIEFLIDKNRCTCIRENIKITEILK